MCWCCCGWFFFVVVAWPKPIQSEIIMKQNITLRFIYLLILYHFDCFHFFFKWSNSLFHYRKYGQRKLNGWMEEGERWNGFGKTDMMHNDVDPSTYSWRWWWWDISKEVESKREANDCILQTLNNSACCCFCCCWLVFSVVVVVESIFAREKARLVLLWIGRLLE